MAEMKKQKQGDKKSCIICSFKFFSNSLTAGHFYTNLNRRDVEIGFHITEAAEERTSSEMMWRRRHRTVSRDRKMNLQTINIDELMKLY